MNLLKRLLALRFRISTQLFAAFGVAVALTWQPVSSAGSAFKGVDTAQAKVNEGSVPELEAAFGVAEFSGALTAAAPRLTTASDDEEVEAVWTEIEAANTIIEGHLNALAAA